MRDFIRQVEHTVLQYDMLARNDTVLAAVSGGPDSVALLHCLIDMTRRYDLRVGVAHLNHGLRGQTADQEAFFVEQLCRRYQLPFHVKKVVLPPDAGSLEERAREQRYAFLEQLAAQFGYAKIALGHQADDNAETVLMNLLRGSGTLGLSGIPPVRDLRYIRPLINIRRDRIQAYLKHKQQNYAKDLSNADLRFDRNRIRHHLLPLLTKRYNPAIVDILNRTARLCAEEELWFQQIIAPYLKAAVITLTSDSLILSTDALRAAPKPIRRRLMRQALRQWRGHIHRIGATHIESLMALLEPGGGERGLMLPGPVQAICNKRHLHFSQGRYRPSRTDYSYSAAPMIGEPLTIAIPEADCVLILHLAQVEGADEQIDKGPDRVVFDADLLKFPLIIRNFRPGDRLRPFGLEGSRKIKKIFADKKIDRAQRAILPLVVCDATILWIVGVRRSDAAVISRDTKTILTITHKNSQANDVKS